MKKKRKRIRVATLQYYIRPVNSFEQFRDQVSALVETAEDYECDMVVFPEYFTVQLLTLSKLKGDIVKQIWELCDYVPKYRELMGDLAKKFNIYIVAGSIPTRGKTSGKIYNKSYFFAPSGNVAAQGKLHLTRFETEDWKVSPHSGVSVFETAFGKVAIAICYDVEFPEIARAAARKGAYILVVPSCTDDRQGFMRVRYCAHARAIENQLYVIQSTTVGSLPMIPAVSLNYGQAAILTPSDFQFARDGILAEGVPNQESMVIGELDLTTIEEGRRDGTVLPLRDSESTRTVLSRTNIITL